MRGKIHIGDKQMEAGRAGELPANQLSCQLEKLGLKMGRLKTNDLIFYTRTITGT